MIKTTALKNYNSDDTIAAPATFPSKAALGVIKISGRRSLEIISKIFLPKKKKNIKKVNNFTLHYGWIVEKLPVTNSQLPEIVDEVLVSIMRSPASYTREDVAEISSHGGVIVLNKILEIVLREGARLALPGEFTYRAFRHGRVGLIELEGVLNIVEAKSEEGLRLAARQLKGDLSGKIEKLKNEIKDIFIETEGCIDFPEDETEITVPKIKRKLKGIEEAVFKLLKGSSDAKILKEGLRCVICGKANAGKSTLFNRLLGEERVIVSRLPGTTRDVVEEAVNIGGIPLKLYDTAGILEPKDFLTRQALAKTSRTLTEADLVIFVLDRSRALDKDDLFLLKKVKNKDKILVINKIDLKQKLNLKKISGLKAPRVYMSALKNKGTKDFEKAIFKRVASVGLDRENVIFLNQFQREALGMAGNGIAEAKGYIEKGYPIDFVNLSLRESLSNLGKLTGEVSSDQVLESIFKNFCIGK